MQRLLLSATLLLISALPAFPEDWPQFMFNAAHSGNAASVELDASRLSLQGSATMTDGIYTSPVVADGRVYVVDGSGCAACFDSATLKEVWRFQSKGGRQNVNNVSSPAIAGNRLHFGTSSGFYYVLDRGNGSVVAEIDCGEPIFSTPVVAKDRVYVATLGAQVLAMNFEGKPVWKWDFVNEVVGFEGNRWSGESWAAFCEKRMLASLKPGTQPTSSDGRVTWKDHFVCSRDICLIKDRIIVVPAGGARFSSRTPATLPSSRRRAKSPNGPAGSSPPPSARAPMMKATSMCSGTAATTQAAWTSCDWRATR